MNTFDVVILAAGVGSRLRPITDAVPKCLVPVNGRSILARLLDQLCDTKLRDFPGIKIYVVAGYLSHQVQVLAEQYGSAVNVIINETYVTTNNMYSFFLAFPHLNPHSDLILVNGDCVYDPRILPMVFSAPGSVIAVDSSVYYEESMKVAVVGDVVRGISKKLPPAPGIHTSIDLYKFSGDVKSELLSIVHQFVTSGNLTQWTEVAINELVYREHVQVKTCDIAGASWVEIDTLEDLAQASKLFW